MCAAVRPFHHMSLWWGVHRDNKQAPQYDPKGEI